MKDFYVEQNTNPENPALIGEKLGAAGVNIEGLCPTTCEEMTVIHFAVEDAVTARRVLENSGIKIRGVSEVFDSARIKNGSPVSLVPLEKYAGRLRIMESKSISGIQPRITDLFLELMM